MTTRPKLTFPDCPTPFSDHVYKTAHGVEVPLRVWPATAGEGRRPWLLWFHGGGFTFGKHYHPNPWVLPAFRSRGYHVVSAAYRFIPHVSLWDVVEDSEDAFAWCRENLPVAISDLGGSVDVDRYVVGGDSMGGLLVTLAGHNFSPRPRALACMYPFTHPEDEYFHPPAGHPFENVLRVGEPGDASGHEMVVKARKSLRGAAGDTLAPMHPDVLDFVLRVDDEFARRRAAGGARGSPTSSKSSGSTTPTQRTPPAIPATGAVPAMASIPLSGTYSPLELYTFLMSRDPKAAYYAAAFRHEVPPSLSLEELRAYWGMPTTWAPDHPILQGDAMVFEYAARQMIRVGCRRELYGSDEEWFRDLANVSAIKITQARAKLLPEGQRLEYPPTFLIHGTADTTTPCYHSKKLAHELKAACVPVQERYAEGENHNFDLDILGPESPKWNRFIAPCMDFVDTWVWSDRSKGAVAGAESASLERDFSLPNGTSGWKRRKRSEINAASKSRL